MQLVNEFQSRNIDLELILVDNGSQDNTGQIIDDMIAEGLPIVKTLVKVNQGYGNGVLQGLRVAQGEHIGFICADGQVEARDVARIYEVLTASKTPKLVKVRRRFRMDGLKRKIVSIVYNIGTAAMFGGLGSIDINGNPKIMPREYLERMNLKSKDWFLDAEVMIKAKELGLEIYELNVLAQMRGGGKSNVQSTTIWEFIKNLVRYRFGRGSSTEAPMQTAVEQEVY
jgi:glycosyltransferase involved in cell wall biosynthesis